MVEAREMKGGIRLGGRAFPRGAARTFLSAALLTVLSTLAFGQATGEARKIQDSLVAPCCWNQPVSQHESEIAQRIRNEVTAMVAAGKSRDEILDHYVSLYGERILVAPPVKGFNTLGYALPWLALLVGAWFLFALIKKMRTPAPATEPPSASSLPNSRYDAIIDKELKELE